MTMKRIYNYIVVGALALAATSCNDSFLDRIPTNDLNDVAFWNTTDDLEAYCNGIYNEAGNNGTYKFMVGFHNATYSVRNYGPYGREMMSDNFVSTDAGHSWAAAIAAGIENQPEGNPNYGSWSWTLLRRINVFMENYDRVQAETSAKLPYVGEALFFRAWFYFYMVQTYGDVPLVTKALDTSSPELYGPRTPRKEVMAQVLDDINKACEYLPAENWGENRLTKGAALALKSRIGLFEGTFRKYHNLGDEREFLNACVEASEELMGMGYSLYSTGNPESDYADLFIMDDMSACSEVIFYRKYAAGLLRHRMAGYVVNLRDGGTKDFVDDYLCIDSDGQARPVGLSQEYSNDTPEQEFTNRDPRLTQTFLKPGNEASAALLNGGNAQKTFPRIGNMTNWPTPTGYHAIKYYSKELDKMGYGNETSDYALFRYAEVLLNYAEAKAELGECTQEVLDKTVNVVRGRVGMVPLTTTNPEMDPKYAKYGISSLLVEIRRERRVELCFEYLRYYDLMRWAWGEKLKERPLGMRLEDADFDNPRYDGAITKGGTSEAGANAVYVYVNPEDGKQYIDPYAGTNYAAERRSFDPAKDYLRPIPSSAIAANPNLEQNPGWPKGSEK